MAMQTNKKNKKKKKHGKKGRKLRKVAGCIPFKVVPGDPEPHFLLISSRKVPGTIVFPKGGINRHEPSELGGQRETWEETGVRGRILKEIINADGWVNDYYDSSGGGDYSSDYDSGTDSSNSDYGSEKDNINNINTNNEKEIYKKPNGPCRWFLLEVLVQDDEFPEKGTRDLLWLPYQEALKHEKVAQKTKSLLLAVNDKIIKKPDSDDLL